MKHYPGVAVRALIRDEQGRILLLKRQNTAHFNGQWCLPGGKVEYGQRIEQALENEVQEETSLICRERRFLFFTESLPGDESDFHFVTFYFYCRASGETSVNMESETFAWVWPEALANYDIPSGHREAIVQALSFI